MARKLKVLYLINGLGTGGAERSLAEMLPHLIQAGVAPAIACFYRRPEGVEQAVRQQGFNVEFIKQRGIGSRIQAVRHILNLEQPDLLHTTIFESDIVGRLAAIGTKIPVLTSLVNTPYSKIRLKDKNIKGWKLELARLIDGWTARHLTKHFHAISVAVKQAAVHDLGILEDRITVIPRGRDPRRLGYPGRERRQRARKNLGLSDRDPVILNVGRQEFQKGQRYLLEALDAVATTFPRVKLIIAGREGNATDELKEIHNNMKFKDNVHFLGHRDDIPEILSAADLFVFPSLYEGLGGALIEAMALGLPIVASNIPVFHEVLEENGNAFLVPPGDPTQLAKAIRLLLIHEQLSRQYGQRSRQIFEQRFTLQQSVQKMVQLYNDVCDLT